MENSDMENFLHCNAMEHLQSSTAPLNYRNKQIAELANKTQCVDNTQYLLYIHKYTFSLAKQKQNQPVKRVCYDQFGMMCSHTECSIMNFRSSPSG